MTEQKEMMVANEVYLKSGIHIGTKFRTKAMEKFIYKTRPDGLSVLNLQKVDERLRIAGRFLSDYEPEDILIVCRRENGWDAVKKFNSITGIDVFAKRYPPGILTNIELETFIEKKVIVIVDEWADRNAIKDAIRMGIAVIALCDTNNHANNIDLIIPCNNKGHKSLGLVFYILAREYMINKGKINKEDEMPIKIDDFVKDE
ncbi:MAG: 30S ribosomal protein S2 [Candidatus Woesearchaeota archaeon]